MRGVYAIIDSTGKAYIGESLHVEYRWDEHRRAIASRKHPCKALNKHKLNALTFVMLWRDDSASKSTLLAAEASAIAAYRKRGRVYNRSKAQIAYAIRKATKKTTTPRQKAARLANLRKARAAKVHIKAKRRRKSTSR